MSSSEESAMNDRITIEGRDGAFGAYITRPKTLPAPAVVVLHEVFGVNADIRKTCDELAEQGFLAVAASWSARSTAPAASTAGSGEATTAGSGPSRSRSRSSTCRRSRERSRP